MSACRSEPMTFRMPASLGPGSGLCRSQVHEVDNGDKEQNKGNEGVDINVGDVTVDF